MTHVKKKNEAITTFLIKRTFILEISLAQYAGNAVFEKFESLADKGFLGMFFFCCALNAFLDLILLIAMTTYLNGTSSEKKLFGLQI